LFALAILCSLLLTACGASANTPPATPLPPAPTLTSTARPTFTPDTLVFTPATATLEPTRTPTATASPTRINPTPVADVYTIGYGDTLLGIANFFGSTV